MGNLNDLLKLNSESGMIDANSKYVKAANRIDEDSIAKKLQENTEGGSNAQQFLVALAREFYSNLGQDTSESGDDEVLAKLYQDTGGGQTGAYDHVINQISAGKFREAKSVIGQYAAISRGQSQVQVLKAKLKDPSKIKTSVSELKAQNPEWARESDEAVILNFDRYASAAGKAKEAYDGVGGPKAYDAAMQRYAA